MAERFVLLSRLCVLCFVVGKSRPPPELSYRCDCVSVTLNDFRYLSIWPPPLILLDMSASLCAPDNLFTLDEVIRQNGCYCIISGDLSIAPMLSMAIHIPCSMGSHNFGRIAPGTVHLAEDARSTFIIAQYDANVVDLWT